MSRKNIPVPITFLLKVLLVLHVCSVSFAVTKAQQASIDKLVYSQRRPNLATLKKVMKPWPKTNVFYDQLVKQGNATSDKYPQFVDEYERVSRAAATAIAKLEKACR